MTRAMANVPALWRWRSAALAVIAALLFGLLAVLAQTYPALTGRVVDQAGEIDAAAKAALETKLASLETKSGIQLVVATVTSLEGQEIEPYANGLFRAWALGQKTRNNGVLLLVAPNEKRVRIEVGYGLEGTLTDALSKVVIFNAMGPRFKTGDFSGGIARGVDDIITILTTDSADWQAKSPDVRLNNDQKASDWNSYLIAALIFLAIIMCIVSPGFRSLVFQILINIALSPGSGRSSGSWGGGSSGGGFSGGGGSSGGGGASGSW